MSKSRGTSTPVKGGIERKMKRSGGGRRQSIGSPSVFAVTLNLLLDTTILYLMIQNRNDSIAVCSVILSFTELGLRCVSCAYNNVFMRSVPTTPVNVNFLKCTIVSSAPVIVVIGIHCNSIHPHIHLSAYSIQGCDGTIPGVRA